MADMRLIDANALVHAWRERTEKLKIENEKGRITKPYMYLDAAIGNAVCEYLSSAPTIDAVEVVHARWERFLLDRRHNIECDKCSSCGFTYGGLGIESFLYCPGCGAKMDGGDT